MVHNVLLFLLAFAGYINGSPTPVRPIKDETISTIDADVGPADLTQIFQTAGLTCAAGSPLLGGQIKHARRGMPTTRIARRASSRTAYGSLIETVPQRAGTPPMNAIVFSQTFYKGNTPNYIEVSTFEDDGMQQHVIPGWLKSSGDRGQVMFQEAHADVEASANQKSLAELSLRLLKWAGLLQTAAMKAMQKPNIFTGSPFRLSFVDRIYDGGWLFVIGAFDGVPGLSYALERNHGQPPPPLAGYSVFQPSPPRTGDPASSQESKALAVAVCFLIDHIANSIWQQLQDDGQYHQPERLIGEPSKLSTRDAFYIHVTLQVLEDLLHRALQSLATYESTPPITDAQAKSAMVYVGTGRDLWPGAVPGTSPQSLLSFQTFTAKLGETQMCRNKAHGITSLS